MAVLAIVALRLGVGWHFFKEGIKKFQTDNFSAAGFLWQAEGPLEGSFKSLIPDPFGHQRLNEQSTLTAWEQYKNQVAAHYGFNENQQNGAAAALARWNKQLSVFFADNRAEFKEYFLEVDQLQQQKRLPNRNVSYQSDRNSAKEIELIGKLNGWWSTLSRSQSAFASELRDIATQQQKARGKLTMTSPAEGIMDKVIPWLILSIGILLLVGLFTRLASLAGAAFLVFVVATQPPWLSQSMPTYYQWVELLALLVLAALGAGRFAGLDSIIHATLLRCCPPKDE